MTGWQWCSGAYGQCAQCKHFVSGLWRYWGTPLVSTLSICKTCAETAASSSA